MVDSPSAKSLTVEGQLIAARFRVERELGAGGLATVYEVVDTATGRHLALKRLHDQPDPSKRQRTIELFEREFHTLAHLAHPRIVEVYDYGLDEAGPYYTMELLDGGELSQLAPLPWRRACEIARDIGAALSILHARRLAFRDLNPRNVRCTGAGIAKLIDFGAMGAFGPSRQVIGTPAYCAPEVLSFEPLDARTDLFSLGATLYFMLTAHHAYPARTFEQLRVLLASRPLRPTEIVTGIPAALDVLVMDLLHVDPALRPANVAEVLEQLATIEGYAFDELPVFTQAYLSTPSLVGRDAVLGRARAQITRALRGRGGALVFQARSGFGRSRMLAACRVDAKLMGLTTLQADASDEQADFGALRGLAAQLLVALPELTLRAAEAHLPVLGHVLPALLQQQPDLPLWSYADNASLRTALFEALAGWLFAISAERPLLIAVDDLHAIDEPSAALLVLLSRRVDERRLLLLATIESDAPSTAASAMKLLASSPSTQTIELCALTAPETEQLLRSVFGDASNVQALAHKLFATTQGNPRDIMQLAQYLVDEKLAQHRAGAWSLPANLDDDLLPASMAQALHGRIAALDPRARGLAQALTLSPERGLTFEECRALDDAYTRADVLEALTALEAAQIVRRSHDTYLVAQRSAMAALQQGLDTSARQRLHQRLATIFERRGNEPFRRGQQLFLAGDPERAVDVWVQFAEQSNQLTEGDPQAFQAMVASLPEDWLELYLDAIRRAAAPGRAAGDAYKLRVRFMGLVNVMGVPSALALPVVRATMSQLSASCGLSHWIALDPSLGDAKARWRIALGAAQKRFEEAPANERTVAPGDALKELMRTLIAAAGMVAATLEHSLAVAMPSLEPLVSLSPALNVVDHLRRGVLARAAGRLEQSCAIYRQLLEFSARPDRAGLEATSHRYMTCGVTSAIGLMEASIGLPTCLDWAAKIDGEPLYVVSAVQIRMVHALWEGRVHDADKHREHFELLRIQTGPRHLSDGPYLIGRVTANAACDDLTRIKHTAEEILEFAQRHAGWWPVSEYAKGEHERIRGQPARALTHLESALALTGAGTHPIWVHAAAAHVRVLRDLGQMEQAAALGRTYLDAAIAAELGSHANHVRLALALALSGLGQFEAAVRLADTAAEQLRALGCRGLALVLAYEVRAQVAIAASDLTAYELAVAELAAQARAGQGRGLRAKHERLKRAARSVAGPAGETALSTLATDVSGTQIRSLLLGCERPSERAQRTLALLLRHSGASEGLLFWHTEAGRELVARSEASSTTTGLTQFIDQFMELQVFDADLRTCSQVSDLEDDEPTPALYLAADGSRHQVVLLGHQTPQGHAITGVALLQVPTSASYEPLSSLAAVLSRTLLEFGDVVPIYTT